VQRYRNVFVTPTELKRVDEAANFKP
jgi:hypothetical protein